MKKRLIAIALLVTMLAVLLSSCAMLEEAAKLTEYDLGTDKVRSVNSVIGEQRIVTAVSLGTQNGTQYKQYTYQTSSMVEDLIAYSTYLQENGWVVTQGYNLYDGNGEMQLGIESADYGKVLIISIAFEETQYAIRINKLVGELSYK